MINAQFHIRSMALLICALMLPIEASAQSLSSHACSERIDNDFTVSIKLLEHQYVLYRWYQKKLRLLYYGPIWKSRQYQLHPTSRNLREQAKKDEQFYLSLAQVYRDRLQFSVQAVHRHANLIKTTAFRLSNCYADTHLSECSARLLNPVVAIVDQYLGDFSSIMQTESQFTQEVMNTVGSESGHYPVDTIEDPDYHDQFYDRFESDHEREIYLQDLRLIKRLEELSRFNSQIAFSDCERRFNSDGI